MPAAVGAFSSGILVSCPLLALSALQLGPAKTVSLHPRWPQLFMSPGLPLFPKARFYTSILESHFLDIVCTTRANFYLVPSRNRTSTPEQVGPTVRNMWTRKMPLRPITGSARQTGRAHLAVPGESARQSGDRRGRRLA